MSNIKGITTNFALQIPINHACFADHFPGAPLVPGALLLKWILAVIDKEYNCRITFLKQIKFISIVRPGDILELQLTQGNNTQQFSFDGYINETLAIKGQFECIND